MFKTTVITTLSLSAVLLCGYVSATINNNLPAFGSRQTSSAADTTLLKVGDKCPDFVFRDTTGNNGLEVKLSNFKGKYVLIDVWASWCFPCRKQYPFFAALEEKMKNKNIAFVSISTDTQVWRWKGPMLTQKGGIQWLVKSREFEKAFAINTIPRFILLDKKGNVLNLNTQLPSHPELEQELKKLKGI